VVCDMGKIFVKAPAESPDDLLSKGPRWDAQRESMHPEYHEFFGNLGRGAMATGRGAGRGAMATGRGAGKLVGGAGGAIVGALSPANSFQEWLKNIISAGKVGYNVINSKSAMDSLKDKYMMEQKGKEYIRQQMQPQIDAQAALAAKEKEQAAALAAKQKEQADFDYLQSVDPKFGQKDFMSSVYGNRSIGEAAKLERRSQDNYAAQQRLEALRAEPKHKRAAAEKTAEELQSVSDESTPSLEETAANLPPVPPQGQPGAPPPESPAGGYANETNSDKLSEDAIINNTGYDLDAETQNVEMLKPQKEEEEVPPPSNVSPAPTIPQLPINPEERVDDNDNIY
jgi:hypothetical protein